MLFYLKLFKYYNILQIWFYRFEFWLFNLEIEIRQKVTWSFKSQLELKIWIWTIAYFNLLFTFQWYDCIYSAWTDYLLLFKFQTGPMFKICWVLNYVDFIWTLLNTWDKYNCQQAGITDYNSVYNPATN